VNGLDRCLENCALTEGLIFTQDSLTLLNIKSKGLSSSEQQKMAFEAAEKAQPVTKKALVCED